MPSQKEAPTIYSARSQFWLGNTLFKPIDMGGQAIDAKDPVLKTHRDRFAEYTPRTRDFGQPDVARKSTVIARLAAPDPEPEPDPVPAHTHPHTRG